jgi:23S rRNA (uracil1939-C5)-methyltransferase
MKTMKTVNKNAVFSLDIENVNAKGFGVGRVNDFVLLVDGALPAERLEVRVIKLKTRYGYGKILRILKPSPHRIKSPCAVSAHCGGCQFQHCDYPEQLKIKKKIVADALIRIGGIENPPVSDVSGMSSPSPSPCFRYRNKGVFPVTPAQNADGFALGMYMSRSHKIVEISDCLIQHPAHARVLSVVKAYMRQNKITAYDEVLHKGLMRQIMLRTSLATKEIMVVLVINGERLPKENELAELLAAKEEATTVIINPHTARSNAVLGERFRVLSGSGYIKEAIGDVRYRISAPSFFQVNSLQAAVLYATALDMMGEANDVLDAHAGAGGIALFAAKRAKRVVGVDISAPAIEDAINNAALNGINNVQFVTGAAEELIPKWLSPDYPFPGEPFKPDAIFLDPPRRGCEPPLLDALVSAKIPKIIYISCDPATLARDIKRLCAGGYKLEAVQPIDMFPYTGHIECVALLLW